MQNEDENSRGPTRMKVISRSFGSPVQPEIYLQRGLVGGLDAVVGLKWLIQDYSDKITFN
jgi:hypothetical protein